MNVRAALARLTSAALAITIALGSAPALAAPGKGVPDMPRRAAAERAQAAEARRTEPAGVRPIAFTRLPDRTVTVAPVRSFAEMRFDRVVRQAYDLSCGAAALATLMKYYWGRTGTAERQIIDAVIAAAPEAEREQIARAGFSMLELKRHAEREGFVAGGFRLPDVNQLSALRAPAITLINTRGYNHFVVIRGVVNGRVLIADPAFGNRAVPLNQFAREWNETILVIVDPRAQGDATFMIDPGRESRGDILQASMNRGLQMRDPNINLLSGTWTTLNGVQFSSFGEY
jgi:predicted double-glycine peptidase